MANKLETEIAGGQRAGWYAESRRPGLAETLPRPHCLALLWAHGESVP